MTVWRVFGVCAVSNPQPGYPAATCKKAGGQGVRDQDGFAAGVWWYGNRHETVVEWGQREHSIDSCANRLIDIRG